MGVISGNGLAAICVRASWLSVVPGLYSNTRGFPARAVELPGGSVPPFESSPAANGLCAPPGEFCGDCSRIAARPAFGRRFESRQHQLHNTAFLKGSGSLIGVQPKIEHLVSDRGTCLKKHPIRTKAWPAWNRIRLAPGRPSGRLQSLRSL